MSGSIKDELTHTFNRNVLDVILNTSKPGTRPTETIM